MFKTHEKLSSEGVSLAFRGEATVAAAALASTTGLAEKPKRGGTLSFAAVAETSGYDCHASQTFALLHPVTPQYSLLVKWDATENSKIVGDLGVAGVKAAMDRVGLAGGPVRSPLLPLDRAQREVVHQLLESAELAAA